MDCGRVPLMPYAVDYEYIPRDDGGLDVVCGVARTCARAKPCAGGGTRWDARLSSIVAREPCSLPTTRKPKWKRISRWVAIS